MDNFSNDWDVGNTSLFYTLKTCLLLFHVILATSKWFSTLIQLSDSVYFSSQGPPALDGTRLEILLTIICSLIRDSSQFYAKAEQVTNERRTKKPSSVLDVTMEELDNSSLGNKTTERRLPPGDTNVRAVSQNVRWIDQ